MELELEIVFNHIYLGQPRDGGMTFRGWMGKRRTGWETADGGFREKGMETKEGIEEENITMAKELRNRVKIEDQEKEKERKELGRWFPGDEVHTWCVCESLNCVQLFATPWTVACRAPLSMEFSR